MEKCPLYAPGLVLSPVTPADLPFLQDTQTDESLWPYEESVEVNRQAVADKYTKRMTAPAVYDYIVRNKADGRAMGVAFLWQGQASRLAWEVGYMLLPPYRGRGRATLAVKAMMAFAFQQLSAHKVLAMCNARNTASAAVLARAGLVLRGRFRREYLCHGQWDDQLYFSLVEDEYTAMAPSSFPG